jgi:hypothetical protein
MADRGGGLAAFGVAPSVVEPSCAVRESGYCGATVEAEEAAHRPLLARLGEGLIAQLPGGLEEDAGQGRRAQRPDARAGAEALVEEDALEGVGGQVVGGVLARFDDECVGVDPEGPVVVVEGGGQGAHLRPGGEEVGNGLGLDEFVAVRSRARSV